MLGGKILGGKLFFIVYLLYLCLMKKEMMKIAACVVLINPEGLVLGVSRKDDFDSMGLPGGKMESIDDNDPINTAIRETYEETGLDIYNLRLVFAIHKDGFMSYTYLANYKGEINHNEPHVVKWLPFEMLIQGSFGEYNRLLGESLKDMGVFFVEKINVDLLVPYYKKIVEESGYVFDNLITTKNWLGFNCIELTFNNSDGSYIDEDFFDLNLIAKITSLNSLYGIKVIIPPDYYPK